MRKQTIVIKVGSAILSDSSGNLKDDIIDRLSNEIASLKKSGNKVILVSSGAVSSGRSLVTSLKTSSEIERRQVLSAVGQVGLINKYASKLSTHELIPAQILVTKSDFQSRQHYLNIRTCLEASIKHSEVLPIVNENDTVATSELMFTDNDELASLIAAMVNANRLIILTSAPGLMTGSPDDPDSKLVTEVDTLATPISSFRFGSVSQGGRGGMATKVGFGYRLSSLGITTHIINGNEPENISKVMSGEEIGTTFIPTRKKSGAKRYLAYADSQESSSVSIDDGAKEILLASETVASLLLVGVTDITGDFEENDIVTIKDSSDKIIGWGRSSMSAAKARSLLANAHNQKPLIHYDYLHLSLSD